MSDRLASIKQKMHDAGLDVLVVSSGINRRWLTGFTGSAGTVVISQTGSYLLVDFRYVEQARQQTDVMDVIQYQDLLKALGELFAKINVSRAGFESAHVVHKTLARLQNDLPGVTWVPVETWIEEARGIKTPAELAATEEAVAIADRAFTQILRYIKPGTTERQLALELEFILRREGAERLAFDTIVASGIRGALPHASPTDKEIVSGDFVTLDFGAVWQGYHSDMTRTVVVGEPSSRQREIYDLVLRAQLAGLSVVAPGRAGREVDAVSRQIITEAGYGDQFGHGLGHGVGLEIHEEYPRLSISGEVVLQPDMVCSVEPGVYIPDWGGVRIEDLVVVTSTGCRVLCMSSKELTIV